MNESTQKNRCPFFGRVQVDDRWPAAIPQQADSARAVVGQCSAETIGSIFAPESRQASSNYGVGYDGKIGMYVEEKNRSWCTSSRANDQRAITIEVASGATEPYAFNDAA